MQNTTEDINITATNESSYTKMPNELLEVLMSVAVNESEAKIMTLVARKTYGFHKQSDQISLTQFQKQLSQSRPLVTRTLNRLVKVGLLVKENGYKRVPNSWLIDLNDYQNKLVKLGQLVKTDNVRLQKLRLSRGQLVKTGQLVTPTDVQLVKTGLHTKEIYTKESYSKDLNNNEHVNDLILSHVHEYILPKKTKVHDKDAYANDLARKIASALIQNKDRLLYPPEDSYKSRAFKARFDLGMENRRGAGKNLDPQWSTAEKLFYAITHSYGYDFVEELIS